LKDNYIKKGGVNMVKKIGLIIGIIGAIYVLLVPVLLRIVFSDYFNGTSLFTLAIPGCALLFISLIIQIIQKK
jgi:hypothetical protein